jgi:hypothetical protein
MSQRVLKRLRKKLYSPPKPVKAEPKPPTPPKQECEDPSR